MNARDIVKTLIALSLDMDYADYLEFAEETVNKCASDLLFLKENGREDLIIALETLASNNQEYLEWYSKRIEQAEI